MILEKMTKTVQHALTGTLTAVVPTNPMCDPIKKLNRALAQIEREYGITLRFSPTEPVDKTLVEAGGEWLKTKIQEDIYKHLIDMPEKPAKIENNEWEMGLMNAVMEAPCVEDCIVDSGTGWVEVKVKKKDPDPGSVLTDKAIWQAIHDHKPIGVKSRGEVGVGFYPPNRGIDDGVVFHNWTWL